MFPAQPGIPAGGWEKALSELISCWPLEALLDEFNSVGYDLAESLLKFFEQQNASAAPNLLHEAVVAYYQKGLSNTPLCITTNWDTLIEMAFHRAGYSVEAAGVRASEPEILGKLSTEPKSIAVYHPHGSFNTRDVVCSYSRQQGQLPISPSFLDHPTLFLGYSGYEPSLYRRIEHRKPQLWCVRDESDFEIPAKRRLLCRPNVFVYVGDLRDLLKSLGVLQHDVSLVSNDIALTGKIPPKVLEVIRSGVLASLNPDVCVNEITEVLRYFLWLGYHCGQSRP